MSLTGNCERRDRSTRPRRARRAPEALPTSRLRTPVLAAIAPCFGAGFPVGNSPLPPGSVSGRRIIRNASLWQLACLSAAMLGLLRGGGALVMRARICPCPIEAGGFPGLRATGCVLDADSSKERLQACRIDADKNRRRKLAGAEKAAGCGLELRPSWMSRVRALSPAPNMNRSAEVAGSR